MLNFSNFNRLQQGAAYISSVVGQVKANGNQCRRLSERINYVIEQISRQSNSLRQCSETTKTLDLLETIIEESRNFIQEFANDSTWFKQIFNRQNNKDQFEKLNRNIEECLKDLHLSISLQNMSDRNQDKNDQEKDIEEIGTKLDEISRLMVQQQGNIEDILNRRFNSFRHHLNKNIQKILNPNLDQTIEPQIQVFLPIPLYDLRLEELIGQGGFADVHRGVWLSRHQQVGVKILRVTYLTDNTNRDFMHEINTMYRIRYDHILNVFGACMEPPTYALVIDYMELGSLFDILKKKEIQFTWPDRWSIALQMTKGINYLHHLQPPIVHRDIKSLNFLLKRGTDPHFLVKVGDFGIAEIRKETRRQMTINNTAPLIFSGTIEWTAPELFKHVQRTLASDVFALAVVFWELATGCIPYEHSEESIIRLAVCNGDRLEIPEDVPDQFQSIITQAWAQNPKERPSCSMVINAINNRTVSATEDNQSTVSNDNNAQPVSVNHLTQLPLEKVTTPNINDHRKKLRSLVEDRRDKPQRIANKQVQGSPEIPSVSRQQQVTKSGRIGIVVDHDQTIYITDSGNDRIVAWKSGAKSGQVIAGGNGYGYRNDQLYYPTGLTIDKEKDSLIICDYGNRRVMRWSLQNNRKGQMMIPNIDCYGLAMDKDGDLYVSDHIKNEVRRWTQGEKDGKIVAGGHEKGDQVDQLSFPSFIFVDEDYSVYVSDRHNHRVMKWIEGAKEGIVVAGGNGNGHSLKQLSDPHAIIIHPSGTIYVVDALNGRIMRWHKQDKEGSVVLGGNGSGKQSNQFRFPTDLFFDHEGNLYVSDRWNNRIQKFFIDFK